MAKITYTDKVKIKDIPVAEINKFTDANANEIKNSVNDLHDNVLQLDNETEYSPDADYEPATKKYVDDSINISGINRIISGQVVWTKVGYTWRSESLIVEINGIIYSSHLEEVTNSAPDATNPRLDKIFISPTGLGIKEGTPAVSPTEPNLDNPESEVQTNLVLVQNGTTTPSEIDIVSIYSENLQEAGGEWDTAENTSGARINLANTTDPINLTKDIKTIADTQAGDYFEFSHSTQEITLANFNNLRLKIKSLGNWRRDILTVGLYKDAEFIGQAPIDGSTIDTSDLVSIQSVFLTKDDFFYSIFATNTSFNKIRFTVVNGGSGGDEIQAQFDLIEIETGGGTIQPIYIGIEEAPIDGKVYSRSDKNWVENNGVNLLGVNALDNWNSVITSGKGI